MLACLTTDYAPAGPGMPELKFKSWTVTKSVGNDGSSQNFHPSDLLNYFDIFAGEYLS